MTKKSHCYSRTNFAGFQRWRCIISVMCISNLVATSTESSTYHNQFAVHIPGGTQDHDKVERIARSHGFVSQGQIGSLEDHFLFEHHSLAKRSAGVSEKHHALLEEEEEIAWFEQQHELKRTKRDLVGFAMPDPLFSHQWFLNHGAVDGSDMNVQPAWKLGFTGKGVVVTILDDGIQTNHPDLVRNYDPAASTDINSNDNDPMPQDNGDNKHGTRCAGEVAAEAFNHVCGVGVAYNASIGGVRMLDGMVNDAVEAKALSLNPDHIDIYSASWGPEDDGKTVDGPGPLAKKAFINGVKYGRKNKGSIFVWASGNGGRKTDNCNCDGYTNSIFTLSISSASQGGRKPWYLEECSSTLSTTYSSGTPSHDASITTVDQDARLRPDKLCTSAHTGTSASAPIAAGVCALALEANPNLTWRDMQHIVVLTSNPKPLLKESGWRENGVGKKYSHKFGYGLMDAEAMVEAAKAWPGVPKQVICETETDLANLEIPSRTDEVARVSMTTGGCYGQAKEIGYLEHVQCKISLQYNPRGALHIVLTSPAGTKSSLLLPRPKDKTNTGFEDWPFLSVHFWGERANGTWTLEINRSPSVPVVGQPGGILKKWKMFFYGTKESPINGVRPSEANSASTLINQLEEEEGSEQKSEVLNNAVDQSLIDGSVLGPDGCATECANGCDGPGPHQCKQCQNLRFGAICVGECPQATFPTVERTCNNCHPRCATCFGTEPNQCLTCKPGHSLLTDTSTCVPECPSGYRLQGSECLPCPDNCHSCSTLMESEYEDDEEDKSGVVCIKCQEGLLLFPKDDVCLQNCPAGFFKNEERMSCEPCNAKCDTCVGPLATQCSVCHPNTFYYERKCVASCPLGFHPNERINECVPCPQGCARCSSDQKCIECLDDWRKSKGVCTPRENSQCKPGSFADQNKVCRECHKECNACNGLRGDNCLSCKKGHLLHIATCVDQCPQTTYVEGIECKHCPHACLECSSLESCSTCQSGYVLSRDGRRCQASCFSNEHQVEGRCQPCHQSCLACKGSDSNHCLSCPVGYVLSNGECLERCPNGSFLDGDTGSCLPCYSSCLSCFGNGPHKCKSCPLGMKLEGDGCLSCEPGNFYDLQRSECKRCHPSCSSCSGPASTQCTACKPPMQLDPWNKTCVPCCRYAGQSGCCQCDAARDRCLQPTNSQAIKRSFREDVATSSKSAFLFVAVMAFVAVGTIVLLRVLSRRKKWAWRWAGNNNRRIKVAYSKLAARKNASFSDGEEANMPLVFSQDDGDDEPSLAT